MFQDLTRRLDRTLKKLAGQDQLTEDNVKEALREVRMALLEADVHYGVAKKLVAAIREKALGTEVMGSPNPGFLGRIRLVVGRDGYGSSYCVPPTGMHLGRDRGDIIFPDDGYVSGLHCRIHGELGAVQLTDVGSSNGTFLRLEEPTPLPTGSLLLMGMQLFRVEY